ERQAEMRADFQEPVVLTRENGRIGLPCRQESELRVVRYLPVDERDELIRPRGLIEPRVEVLEQSSRDLTVAIELVDRPEQKRLMQHRRQERIGHAMPGHVDQRDASLVLTLFESGARA